jgi:hypothetical protein
MEPIDFLIARMMATEAAVKALIATHPDRAQISHSIREAGIGLSSTAMQGNQAQGMQTAFDKALANYIPPANLKL